MGTRTLQHYCQLDAAGEPLLAHAMRHYALSAQAYARMRKIARTIAALAGADGIMAADFPN
jgi:predicted ATPase with chaperone activity